LAEEQRPYAHGHCEIETPLDAKEVAASFHSDNVTALLTNNATMTTTVSIGRFSRCKALLLIFFAFVFGIAATMADSPASLSGYTLEFSVTSATAPFSGTGKYRFYIADDGASYSMLNVGAPSDSTGSCSYTRTGVSIGRWVFNDSVRGSGFSVVLTFEGSTSGSFFLGNTNYPGYQRGNFTAYVGLAPATIGGKRIQLSVTGGAAPFDAAGTYNVITASSTYVTEETPGEAASTGNIFYSKRNRTSGNFGFEDAVVGWGFNALTFATPTNGTFLLRQSSGNGYQTGTFSLGDYLVPAFTRHPTNRTVVVGNNFVLSAVAAGSPPIRYQWYKNGNPINAATNATYTVAYAQTSHTGSYSVTASNLGGSVASSNAQVTVVCSYSLSTNAVFFNCSGGNRSVLIRTTGDCQWQAHSSNHWITVTSASTGTGDGSITFNVAANNSITPRTGMIVAGGKQLIIAQGGDFAPATLAGKTVVFTVLNGSTNRFSSAKVSLVAGSGTNWTYRLLNANSNFSGNYRFTKTGRATVALTFSPVATTLNFTTPVSGTFSGNDGGDPIGGTFRVIGAAPDLSADARGDLLLQNTNRVLASWLMNGTNVQASVFLRNAVPASMGWRAISSGDFNRDGHADILFSDHNGKPVTWLMNRTNQIGTAALPNAFASSGWTPVAANDFNSDAHTDVLVRHSTGRMAIWFYARTNFITSALLKGGEPLPSGWTPVATGDMNDDAQIDIVFQHDNGQVAVWLMNGSQFIVAQLLRNGQPMPVGWRIVGKGDFNSDGYVDLVWLNGQRQVVLWQMNRMTVNTAVTLQNGQSLPLASSIFGPK
jgi:hypothetical protein